MVVEAIDDKAMREFIPWRRDYYAAGAEGSNAVRAGATTPACMVLARREYIRASGSQLDAIR